MPPGLNHWPDKPRPFTCAKSEVFQWLTSQPEILHYLLNKFKDAGAIEFDAETGTWRGAGL
jgi:hypothetical protein